MREKKDYRREIEMLKTEVGFKEIFMSYFNSLKAYAITIINEENIAKDIVQEVFLGLWKKRKTLKPTPSLSSYLYKSVYNKCLNYHKHERVNLNFIQKKTAEQELHEMFYLKEPPVYQNIDFKRLQIEIQNSIENLPEQCKKVFILSRKFGLKNREIAEVQEISIKAVEKHIHKALKILREKLSIQFPDLF